MAKIIITEDMFRALSAKYALDEVNENAASENYDRVYNMVSNLILGGFRGRGNNNNASGNASRQDSMMRNQSISSTPGVPANGVDKNCLNFIAFEENSNSYPYTMPKKDLIGWVNKQDKPARDGIIHKTYGYGLVYTPDGSQFMDKAKPVPVYTQQELEKMFVDSCNMRGAEVMQFANSNGIKLGQNQFNALVSAVYNYGRRGFFEGAGKTVAALIANNPNDTRIPKEWAKLRANNNRRQREAALYARDIPNYGVGGGQGGVRE